jgi:hypothetical protein
MDLLAKTFETTNSFYHIGDNGEKVYRFKTTHVEIDESITYHIQRVSIPNSSHLIERSKKGWGGFSDRRYKMYNDDKSFENAIKRIEKMAQKSAK